MQLLFYYNLLGEERQGKTEHEYEKGMKETGCHHTGSGNDGFTDAGGMHLFTE